MMEEIVLNAVLIILWSTNNQRPGCRVHKNQKKTITKNPQKHSWKLDYTVHLEWNVENNRKYDLNNSFLYGISPLGESKYH